MTNITDQQRREVAGRLRKLKPWSAEGDIEVDEVLTAAIVARCKKLAGVE